MNLNDDEDIPLGDVQPTFQLPLANNVLPPQFQLPTAPTRVSEDAGNIGNETRLVPQFTQYPPTGAMWSNLAQGLDAKRDSVFRRVENPNTPHVFLPHLLSPGYDLNVDETGGVAFEWAVKFAACGTKGEPPGTSTAYVTNQLLRGEMNPQQNRPYRWETGKFCTHTLFPTKFTRTVGKKVDTFFMSYYCFYSSFPIRPPAGSFQPDYHPFTLNNDATITGETASGAVVYIDRSLINDENALLSIIASCQNAYALDRAYITFIPRIDSMLFRTSTHWSDPSKYTIGGSSLGLAVFAAIKGWLPVLYTGYLNAPLPGGKLITAPDARAVLSVAKYDQLFFAPATSDGQTYNPYYDDKPWYLNPDAKVSQTQAPATWDQGVPIIDRYMAQPNFVESVGAVFSKIIYAVTHKIPIFIPMQTSFRTDMVSYIAKFRSNPKAIQWMGLVPTYYLASMMEDGYPQLTRQEGSSVTDTIPNIFMPLTMTDASTLQLRLFRNLALMDQVQVAVGFAGGAARRAQTNLFNNAERSMVKIAAAEYAANERERAVERKAVRDAREEAARQNLNKTQTFNLINTQKERFAELRKENKKAKKDANAVKVTAGKTAIDALRKKKSDDEIERRNLRLKEQARFRAIDNPTEAQKSAYRQKLMQIKNMKKPTVKQQYAQVARIRANPQKYKKNAMGVYDDDTRAKMKALKAKNNDIIQKHPEFNLGQKSSATVSKNRKEALAKQAEEAALYRASQNNNNQGATAGQTSGAGAWGNWGTKYNGTSKGLFGTVGNILGDGIDDILDL